MNSQVYHWDSADYAQHSCAQNEWAQELIDKLDLRGAESVLDIGCGDGRVTADLARRLPGGFAVGIDRSLDMVCLARQRYPQSACFNLDFCCMDAGGLAFDSAFDVAFSNAALHWVSDHPAVLAGVRRSLKPGGKLLFQMGGRGNAGEAIAILERVMEEDVWKRYFRDFHFPYHFYGPEEYRPWLEQAGLKAGRVELIPKDMRHNGREELAGWIRTTWLPYTQRVPEQLRDAFIADIVEAYLREHMADAGGIIHVRMVRLEVEAVRAP